ncbi:hypothetical protein SVI_3666 [Shewanella violacea DSS12]|uniref:Uncharacterized protein n=1 Tax=Shewanella violacea (strain JCM 10179 / CIP 106290 / LMG 19151 / DSS12) TaxID=637905 RepID=D4ZC92_SHEVD|nr:hypothetical protein SVI_3666 [Shewanella violacea DSS12]
MFHSLFDLILIDLYQQITNLSPSLKIMLKGYFDTFLEQLEQLEMK